jgi:hypothetical protein
LIEVMKSKMLSIQFESDVNLIQMWLMKVSNKMKNSVIQQFQYHFQVQSLMSSRNFESICHGKHQSECHFQ